MVIIIVIRALEWYHGMQYKVFPDPFNLSCGIAVTRLSADVERHVFVFDHVPVNKSQLDILRRAPKGMLTESASSW
jgi:hypothetical protein